MHERVRFRRKGPKGVQASEQLNTGKEMLASMVITIAWMQFSTKNY